MLDRYIGECMVSIYNIKNGIKNLPDRYPDCNTSQILIFDGYHKMKE